MLGLVSLFMDLSSELIHALLPIFLVTTMGMSMSALGVLEGAAEATAMIVRIFSGPVSDWLGGRKPLLLLGYGLAALSKPLFPPGSYACGRRGSAPHRQVWQRHSQCANVTRSSPMSRRRRFEARGSA
ncbi:hypothetical protein PTKU64_67710 [Paraburkholderia terrae]|uniref:Major facilitator superfamily (MFS) profile domain-containing protein n=1 Tax=Paraburkholderia terrae TaxID=311230 RepID=A0ABN6JQ80_9BURK|nr:hypothetical protein PTKU64_67710 [Paraburkholderia terrae]